ncbi:MAG TPA: hypothetical protein VK619_03845 [Pyrinomonadaceae bacterium]|nr:hypothetical protein [Pyrinomonadaceae bacterium]
MNRILTHSALTLALALGVGASAASAKTRHKHSAEHNAAVKKCNDDYNVAVKAAKTKRGADRTAAMTEARNTRKQCIASAPQ